MGVVVSAIATGLLHNIERDFGEQKVGAENLSIDKNAVEETIISKTPRELEEGLLTPENEVIVVTPVFPTIKLDIEPLHNDRHLNKQNRNNPQINIDIIPLEKEVIADREIEATDEKTFTPTHIKEANNNEKQEEDTSPLSFFHDFFSSLGITNIEEEDVQPKELIQTQKGSVTFVEDLPEFSKSSIFLDESEDFSLPIINLLPRLTEDLDVDQRRPNCAWFRKNYTNVSTIQKIYLTHPQYTPSRRPQTCLLTKTRPTSRSVSLMNTPLHARRKRVEEEGTISWKSFHDQEKLCTSGVYRKHMLGAVHRKCGISSLVSSPKRAQKTKIKDKTIDRRIKNQKNITKFSPIKRPQTSSGRRESLAK